MLLRSLASRLRLRPTNTACTTLKRWSTTLPHDTAASATAITSSVAPSISPSGLLKFARESPYKTNIIIATLKTSLCDILVQKYIEKKEEINWRRNAIFLAFGCIYLGGVQWFVYVDVFKRLWPGMAAFANQPLREKLRNPAGIRALFGQVAFDNFVHYPLMYFPFFYVIKEGVKKDPGAKDASLGGVAAAGLERYRQNCVEDNLKIWTMWIPGDLVVYAVPIWMRLPLNHGISFLWTCYLSFLRGGSSENELEAEGAVQKTAGELQYCAPSIANVSANGRSDTFVRT